MAHIRARNQFSLPNLRHRFAYKDPVQHDRVSWFEIPKSELVFGGNFRMELAFGAWQIDRIASLQIGERDGGVVVGMNSQISALHAFAA